MSILPTKILVAVDEAEEATLALRTAVDLADNNDSELHAVHVITLSPWAAPEAMHPEDEKTAEDKRLKEDAWQILDEQIEKIQGTNQGASEAVAEKHFRVGEKVDEQVVDLADEIGAGLIVVGSRGKNTMRRLLLGSEAESVVRHAHCPVLVVRQ
ncbi:MAG: universal stress protein [Rubrobacteraceae bacterium]